MLPGSPASADVTGPGLLQNTSLDGSPCLDSDGSRVYANPCDRGNAYQNWRLDNMGNAEYRFIHYQSGRCLDGNGSDVYAHDCNGGDFQIWIPEGKCWRQKATGKHLNLHTDRTAVMGPCFWLNSAFWRFY